MIALNSNDGANPDELRKEGIGMTETTKEPRRIDHRRALVDYLALGRKRSLSKLCRHYAAAVPNPAGLPTLKFWSKRDAWKMAAAQHDERVTAQVVNKLERATVSMEFDQIQAFIAIIENGTKVLDDFISDPENLKKVTTAADFSAVSNALVRLSQLVELLNGKPTTRFDSTHRVVVEPPEWRKSVV